MNSKLLQLNGQGNIEAWELVSFFPKILGPPSLDLLVRVILSCFIVEEKRICFLLLISSNLLFS